MPLLDPKQDSLSTISPPDGTPLPAMGGKFASLTSDGRRQGAVVVWGIDGGRHFYAKVDTTTWKVGFVHMAPGSGCQEGMEINQEPIPPRADWLPGSFPTYWPTSHFPLGLDHKQLEAWLDFVEYLLGDDFPVGALGSQGIDCPNRGWRSAVRAARNLAEYLGATIPPRETTTPEEGRSLLLVCQDAIFAALRRRVDCQQTAHATDTPATPRHEEVHTPAAPNWIARHFRQKQYELIAYLWGKEDVPESVLLRHLEYNREQTETLQKLVMRTKESLLNRSNAIGESYEIRVRTRGGILHFYLDRTV